MDYIPSIWLKRAIFSQRQEIPLVEYFGAFAIKMDYKPLIWLKRAIFGQGKEIPLVDYLALGQRRLLLSILHSHGHCVIYFWEVPYSNSLTLEVHGSYVLSKKQQAIGNVKEKIDVPHNYEKHYIKSNSLILFDVAILAESFWPLGKL